MTKKSENFDTKVKHVEKKRKSRNDDLLHRFKRGDNLASMDMHESWYPIRPKIKKNLKEMKRVFEED